MKDNECLLTIPLPQGGLLSFEITVAREKHRGWTASCAVMGDDIDSSDQDRERAILNLYWKLRSVFEHLTEKGKL